jgi:hypothetical protein
MAEMPPLALGIRLGATPALDGCSGAAEQFIRRGSSARRRNRRNLASLLISFFVSCRLDGSFRLLQFLIFNFAFLIGCSLLAHRMARAQGLSHSSPGRAN